MQPLRQQARHRGMGLIAVVLIVAIIAILLTPILVMSARADHPFPLAQASTQSLDNARLGVKNVANQLQMEFPSVQSGIPIDGYTFSINAAPGSPYALLFPSGLEMENAEARVIQTITPTVVTNGNGTTYSFAVPDNTTTKTLLLPFQAMSRAQGGMATLMDQATMTIPAPVANYPSAFSVKSPFYQGPTVIITNKEGQQLTLVGTTGGTEWISPSGLSGNNGFPPVFTKLTGSNVKPVTVTGSLDCRGL